MYNITEIFAENNNGLDLKEILKSCLYNYYKKYKKDLQKEKKDYTMDTTNIDVLSNQKGEVNV